MFDKETFSEILTKIHKTYNNQRDFADVSGVNRTYLSQYMNKKIDTPPTPKILERISNSSNGITTYNELMVICGYMKDEFKNFTDLSNKLAKNKAYINCYNLLSSTTLSKTEVDKMLYYITTVNIDDIGNDEKRLKSALISILENFPKENRELAKIILNKYWTDILEYRKEAIEFLSQNNHRKTIIDLDEADVAFASGVKALNETNKMIIKNTLEALLAKQEKDENKRK